MAIYFYFSTFYLFYLDKLRYFSFSCPKRKWYVTMQWGYNKLMDLSFKERKLNILVGLIEVFEKKKKYKIKHKD